MPRILLLEDEDGLRASLTRGLSREAGWTLVDAPDLNAGLQLIDQQAPDVIISDIDMPGRTGIEILGELGKRGLQIPVVFLTAYMKAFSAQVPKHRHIDMREKPISLDDLRALVREKLAPAAETTPPAPFNAADYLQLACMGAHSVIISLHRGDVLCGEINVFRGEVWSAKEDKTLGKEAFMRLFLIKRCTQSVARSRGIRRLEICKGDGKPCCSMQRANEMRQQNAESWLQPLIRT
jgi:CheY-like chemotaxis protein